MYLIDFLFDFETKSRLELPDRGLVNYSLHPSTEATLLTYCFGRSGTIKVWRQGEPIPADLLDVALHPEKYRFIAWNIQFDYMIWTQVLSRLIPGLIRPALANLDDAMALSCHFRTGASLASAATFLNLPINKDPDGRRIMLKQCKPNAKGEFPVLTEDEWQRFTNYGVMDTRILRDVYYRLPPLPEPERYAWEWTFRRNLRGIRVDEELLDELDSIVQDAMPTLATEFNTLVGHKFKMNSPVKCKDWFKQYYPWIGDMRADTVRDMLAEDPSKVPPFVRRALELKDLAGSTSIAKLKTMKALKNNGKIYELLAYHYAHTKRWSGRGCQIQNFPRVDDKKPDKLDFDLNVQDLAAAVRTIRPLLKDPVGFAKNLLRRVWVPSPGNHFYCGDFSKVEPSVLYWLLGKGDIPKKWYEEMAAEIYSMQLSQITKDGEERQVGKSACLGCGYGMGWENFRLDTYKKTGIMLTEAMAKQVVSAYRRKEKEVVQFWDDLEVGFRKAIYGQASSLCAGKLHIMPMAKPYKGVQIRLPSGGMLFYHQADERMQVTYDTLAKMENGKPMETITAKEWENLAPIYKTQYVRRERLCLSYLSDYGQGSVGRAFVYGGKLCENVVSATARDILVPAMWRLENAGFDVLGVVHDEIWADAVPGRDEEFNRVMCVNPSWCNMLIGSDLKVGVRYLK